MASGMNTLIIIGAQLGAILSLGSESVSRIVEVSPERRRARFLMSFLSRYEFHPVQLATSQPFSFSVLFFFFPFLSFFFFLIARFNSLIA